MTSLLKRKRSDSELSFSSCTTLPSPPRPAAGFDISAAATDSDTPVPSMFCVRNAPLHLPSRTLKRFRNNRPSDSEVHEHTLNMLYAAQQSACRQASPPLGQAAQQDDQVDPPSSPRQHGLDCAVLNQPSLYSFWSPPRPDSRRPPPSVVAVIGCLPATYEEATYVDGACTVGADIDLSMAGAGGQCFGS